MDQKNAPVHRLVHRFWNVAENYSSSPRHEPVGSCAQRLTRRRSVARQKMNVNRNYYEMQLEGHPLAPAEVDVTNRQLDRFRELVRRGKGRRDFDDDCSYEVRARSARGRTAACARACSHACVPSCARLRAWLTAIARLQGAFSGGELNGHGVYTFNDGSTYDGMHAIVCGCSACVALRCADGILCNWFAK
jgi:hypothetical protein